MGKVPVQKIDTRSQYAFFEYGVRTADNVELTLEGTIFWQIQDVPKMIEATGDPKGDVWYHARSVLIQAISRVTFEEFMSNLDAIVQNASSKDHTWYEARGCVVHQLEVTRYECKDQQTRQVLQEIIEETTNRINRMQKEESDSEVQKAKMTASINIERQRSELINIQMDNERVQAIMAGEGKGLRLARSANSFFEVLNVSLPNSSERLELLRFFEEQRARVETAAHIASGNATLFLTPQDMQLKLQMPN